MNFKERLKDPKPILLDGGMGTQLFTYASDHTGPYETLNIEKPDVIEKIHKNYIEAGAEVIETNTFGASSLKLSTYNLENRTEEINERGALAAKKAAGTNVFVAGSIGPTGKLIQPMGDTEAEEVYNSFAAQVKGLQRGGADLFIIETMNDLQEAKLAVLAAKDNSSLPVIASMTFEENGKSVSGTDMITGLASLASYGADVAGANCSMGPRGIKKIYQNNIDDLKSIGIPLSVWANAGMPQFIEGKTVYPMSPEEFADLSLHFLRMGIHLVGGCCGTTPEHIHEIHKKLADKTWPDQSYSKTNNFITSRTHSIDLKKQNKLIIIGERLNPSARKKFAADLKEEKQNFLRTDSKVQESEGAQILDINVGLPGIDEAAAIEQSVLTLSQIVNTPLMIDSDNKEVIEKALLTYPGVAILNSINGKKESLDTLVPIVKRFGCFVVALCLDDTGIHISSSRRIKIGESVLAALKSEGIDSDRVFIDPLILTESAEPGAAVETLKVIEHFSRKGIKTSIGLSNVSFGLPQRKYINNAFLNLAIERGLTAAISNPAVINAEWTGSAEEKLAISFLKGEDPDARAYIKYFKTLEDQKSGEPSQEVKEEKKKTDDILSTLYTIVVDGNSDEIIKSTEKALETYPPVEIMNEGLLKGLEKVGDLYSEGEYFLPQMIASANTMKKGFGVLKPLLAKESTEKIGKVLICTVKGDVHDIGKNIVAMMMENHGFEVHDMGKDVPTETIIEKAKEINPDIICLSSLLTTTMNEMKNISLAIKENNLHAKMLIGGAVVNQEYADSIGAIYGEDAVDGVNKAKMLVK